MKQWMTVALMVAVMTTVSCANQKAPAAMALAGLESAVAAAQPEIERCAGEQMAGITSAVTATRKKFDGADYAGVIADVQTTTTAVTTAATAAAAKKAELVTEWGSFASLPALVGQITAQVTELGAMKRLPKGMDKTTLDGATASLDSVNTLWTDASAAFAKGDLVAAVAKAKDVKPMIDTLMTTLGMTATAK